MPGRHDALICVDPAKETDNLLIATADGLVVATAPPSEALRLANSGEVDVAQLPHWIVSLRDIHEAKAGPGYLEVDFQDREGEGRLRHQADANRAEAFLTLLEAEAGGDWRREERAESPLKASAAMLGFALVFAAATALFFFGFRDGWLRRGPAMIVLVYEFLGLAGILVVGGLATAGFLLGAFKTLLAPGRIVSLRRMD
jgi:hypothetical protein